jgi:hypothetical protein
MEEIEEARLALGYTVCLTCGEEEAKAEIERKSRRVAIAYAKGGYQYITEETNLGDLG